MADKPDLPANWLFVDDQPNSAESFRERLLGGPMPVPVVILGHTAAREELLRNATMPLGVLMDVDLSAEAGELGSGLGFAQDIRAKQKAMGRHKNWDFPIVRFANPDPVRRHVGGDPASDDLFEDHIDKGMVGTDLAGLQQRLHGVRAVYDGLSAINFGNFTEATTSLFSLAERELADWVHPSLTARLADGLAQALHVAAGTYCRSFLRPPGLLVDRGLLLMRMGVSADLNAAQWQAIETEAAPFKFSGIGAEHFERWWARGLEEYWDNIGGGLPPLSMVSVSERVVKFSEVLKVALPMLTMPDTSIGDRPWRWCALSREDSPPVFVPIDPRFAVRLTPRTDLPPWLDPPAVAYGVALRRAEDQRLDPSDLQRLKTTV